MPTPRWSPARPPAAGRACRTPASAWPALAWPRRSRGKSSPRRSCEWRSTTWGVWPARSIPTTCWTVSSAGSASASNQTTHHSPTHMPRPRRSRNAGPRDADGPLAVRIIGGSFRGRTLSYSGDARTRPMKDRVREAMFNLLAERIRGKHAIDLFAGTGVLGLEALSRGATKATLIERHLPTAKLIEQNAKTIGGTDRVEGCCSDDSGWAQRWV